MTVVTNGEGAALVPDCTQSADCAFFNDRMREMPRTSEIYKKTYCHRDFESCARYKIATQLGVDKMPEDLYPNQVDRAFDLIIRSSD